MIKDLKGEMPNNVTTPENAKAQKPFYRNWKFWVLTGLMTLFGACSIYGLVLGSQYVKAIERASHVIADANSGASSLNKKPNYMPTPTGYTDDFTFNFVLSEPTSGFHLLKLIDGSDAPASPPYPALSTTYTPNQNTYFYMYLSGRMICISDYCTEIAVNNCAYVPNGESGFGYFRHDANSAWPMTITGKFHFKPYVTGYSQGESDGYSDGYQEGSADGYEDGYQEGYSDGSDAINVNQAFRVVMPVGNDSVQYESFLDGVADAQGTIVGGTTAPNYREFTRNRNQVLRVDLTLPSGYRAFWSYTPAFTASFPVDDNISLQQSWAVDGVVYLPTWVSSVQIWVGVTSAQVPDLTYQTISVAFDVAHWGDIKVGAYQQGYQQGYVDGQQDPTAYQSGYDAGYSDGHDAGEVEGFNRGVGVGSSGSSSLAHMFRVAFQLPFDQLYAYLNFNLLGINFASLFSALITVSLGIIVIKKVL